MSHSTCYVRMSPIPAILMMCPVIWKRRLTETSSIKKSFCPFRCQVTASTTGCYECRRLYLVTVPEIWGHGSWKNAPWLVGFFSPVWPETVEQIRYLNPKILPLEPQTGTVFLIAPRMKTAPAFKFGTQTAESNKYRSWDGSGLPWEWSAL